MMDLVKDVVTSLNLSPEGKEIMMPVSRLLLISGGLLICQTACADGVWRDLTRAGLEALEADVAISAKCSHWPPPDNPVCETEAATHRNNLLRMNTTQFSYTQNHHLSRFAEKHSHAGHLLE